MIRAMTDADIGPIAAWMSALPLWQRYNQTVVSLRTALAAAPVDDLLLVFAQPHPVGLAWCKPIGGFGRSPYLKWLAVDAAQQDRGIGVGLLNDLEGRLSTTYDDLFLLVSDFNQAAHRFYRHYGYICVGQLPGYVLPDVTEYLYWKHFDSKGGGSHA